MRWWRCSLTLPSGTLLQRAAQQPGPLSLAGGSQCQLFPFPTLGAGPGSRTPPSPVASSSKPASAPPSSIAQPVRVWE